MIKLRSIPARIESLQLARSALGLKRDLKASEREEHQIRIQQTIEFLQRCEANKGAVAAALAGDGQ